MKAALTSRALKPLAHAMLTVLVLTGISACTPSEEPSVTVSAPTLSTVAVPLQGWELASEPQLVVGDALFELINGGAELYHRLGFTQALSAEYLGADNRSISLEIFEMTHTEAAHAIFLEKTGDGGEHVELGDEATVEDYYLNFRSGRFVVTITGFDSDAETKAGLLTLARAVATQLGDTT